MLRRFAGLSGQVRKAHTRAKKISVQLLRDFDGIGHRGEVIDVREGTMRNLLHPKGGAAYVLPNVPLRIPLRERTEAPSRQAVFAASKEAEAQVLSDAESSLEAAAEEEAKKRRSSLLDSLNFPAAPSAQAGTASGTSGLSSESDQSTGALGAEQSGKGSPSSEQPSQFAWQNEFVTRATRHDKR